MSWGAAVLADRFDALKAARPVKLTHGRVRRIVPDPRNSGAFSFEEGLT
jgi:hypothetical protein